MKSIRKIVLALTVSLPSSTIAALASPGAVDRHITHGEFSKASVEARSSALNPDYRWLPAYVRGYDYLRRGNLEKAEAIARRLLVDHPDSFRVRHLLINVLVAGREYQAAIFHIERNLPRTRNPQVRAQYAKVLADYEKASPKFGVSLSMSANPSTNITRGTGSETIYLNGLPFKVGESSQARSGSTIAAGVTVYRRFALAERSNVVISGRVTLEKDIEQKSKDVLTFAPGVQFVHRFGKTLLSAGPIAEFQWRDYEPLANRFGVSASAYHPLTDRTSARLQLRALKQTYPELDYLDGYKVTFGGSLRHELTPSLAATGGIEVEREKAEVEHLTYNLGKAEIGLQKQWSNGFYTDVSLSYGQKRYDGSMGLAGSDHRRDERFEFQVGVAHKRFSLFGVMPYIGYRYTRNNSTTSLYTFESNDLIISGRKSF